ncbi:protein dead ringer isoform X3 [Sitodiplosis mosellana]|uniref:protein dead ringer isoform X3 n=1 Tax=Sitodiplosis mosellana TaxID=263140 RepID=UPI0024444371|nr:protein dead ringer isoform X3 [Sitodiplosis mosellana]XP_055323579.1 protein dead ringer isoform X3 [Sitodiplosis mosellana]XP_055323580.1 protein dead ringer isoform X3 [Sitodiplosis mosellana]
MDERRIDRDSDLGDDSPMSNSHADEHSDREEDDMMREECESSDEGVNLNAHTNETETALDFASSPKRSPSNNTNISSHHSTFGPSHALSMLSNFMGVPNIQNLSNLPHNDVLEKLKMQVGLMDPDFAILRNLNTPPNSSFNMPPGNDATSTTLASQPHNLSTLQSSQQKNFSFTTPNAPNTKDGNLESNSSTSSDASNSSQQNNGWSFEEQFKQVRQLYEISDEPKRKEFLDDLFHFMQRRGTPINRLPIMAKSVLDLYELYNLVIARGGLVDVINKKLWQEIIKGLHLPSSITSAAFTLRTQYMKYLYPYECEKKNLSTPAELQAAIDGNRREGRRSSYGQFDTQMQGQLQQLVQRSPLPGGLQQMSPLSLVSHGATQNSHHRLLGNQQMGLLPNQMSDLYEYFKLLQQPKEAARPQSPDCIRADTLNALEMSRVALWSMYNNNTSPPTSNNTTSPPNNEPQREALNLTESPTHGIKRERDTGNDFDREERDYVLPSKKVALQQLHSQLQQSQRVSPHNHYNHEHRRRSETPPSPNHRNRSIERDEHRNGLLSFHNSQNHSSSRRHMSASPPSSNHRNGTNNTSHNGSNDLLNACSPLALLSGMQFKLFSRGSESGEQQLVVSMELNGVQYEGVLFANRVNAAQSTSPTSSPPCTPSKITPTTTSSGASASSPMVEDRPNRGVPTVTRPLVSS